MPAVYVGLAEPTVRVLKLLRDELDILQGDLPPELVAWLEERSDVRVQTAPGTNFTYLGFNLQDPVAGKLAVRRAIAHAVDREAIIRHVLGGAARPANALLPPDHWAGTPGLVGYPHDPERARALLRSANDSDGHPLRLVYKTSSDPFRIRLATIVQHQLHQVGLDVEIRSYDWGTFYGDIKAGRFQLYSLSWVGLKMPDIFRYIFHSTSVPPAGANRGRFASSAVDAPIERAEASGLAGRADCPVPRGPGAPPRELSLRTPVVRGNVLVTRPGIREYPLAADGNFDGLMTVVRRVED